METQVFDTKPLLRPHQVEDMKSEIKSAEAKLQSPHIEDKGEVAKQLRRLQTSFQQQAPKPPVDGAEEGRMVARSRQLLSEILAGMPSQEEMRKAPPGAVDKHMKWESRNKSKIMEWKNLQIRLTHGQEPEAANLERHRPTSSSLNMDNAYIQGKQFFLPPVGTGLPVTFSDEQLALLRSINPDIADMIGTLSAEQRREVKNTVFGIGLEAPSKASLDGKKGVEKREAAKRTLSPEHKKALADGRKRAAEAKTKKG